MFQPLSGLIAPVPSTLERLERALRHLYSPSGHIDPMNITLIHFKNFVNFAQPQKILLKYNQTMPQVKINAIYKHYKGGLYRVIGIAKYRETMEDLVIYEALYDNPVSKLWARPISAFTEKVVADGKEMERFVKQD